MLFSPHTDTKHFFILAKAHPHLKGRLKNTIYKKHCYIEGLASAIEKEKNIPSLFSTHVPFNIKGILIKDKGKLPLGTESMSYAITKNGIAWTSGEKRAELNINQTTDTLRKMFFSSTLLRLLLLLKAQSSSACK